jgi:predicted nucleotidyltransferase component of viral defense system
MTPSANVAASVRQRLLNRARADKRPFNELLQYYAMERFLYRLSKSFFSDRFILKGALLLRAWDAPEFRPTMDIDMLGKTSNEEADILSLIRNILIVPVEEDGLIFDSGSLQSERITEDADYEGIRVRFRGVLDTARIVMQIDIGFGDIVYPAPEEAVLPTMLEFPAPKLLCYSRESAIAEKFEAMIKLGFLNSRMKDFYDIWLLSRGFDFTGPELGEAIRLTFEQRQTTLPVRIESFSEDFVNEKQVQWAAFHKKLNQEHIPMELQEVVKHLDKFLAPIVSKLTTGQDTVNDWIAPGPWK